MSDSEIPTLDVNFAWYHPFNWMEYDWLATDLDGLVANISTAGFGPIPQAVEDAAVDFAQVDDRLRRLPEVSDFDPDVGDPLQTREILDIARRGIFFYDWVHSLETYHITGRPLEPLPANKLGDPEIRAWAAIITLPIRFSEVPVFACRTTGKPLL